ncbi:MAG: tetratricopeptide repeat protein [Nostoc sp. DedSLP03]|uniref:CHAT domain-containing protein n=1 Tax=Nostoc sp. DedSLP03 TaxID=3075400 RepID=UPI002AD22B8E|nr:CHAT domain-containing protein [Nostoc sp. DedSLP03]MDZ7969419.1 tetratricopeptide repeat protein [Nostoc sp. DedSLP03]
MNEQRQQAYYQLIQNLLSCPNGEESEILAANTELLDAGFLQVLAAVADDFAQQGEENTANWLRNLATYVTPEATPITQEDIETYEQFLLEILQATADSKGDAEVIYPLLAANTDKLNHIFAELLRDWATNTLAEAEPDAAVYIAAVMIILSNRIRDFPLGSKANNIEIAMTGYDIALTVYTRSAFPFDWAGTQFHLGEAYRNRILGERAENIELAIAAYNQALEIITKSAFPVDWAGTQNNLGIACVYRILGERAENIELAIAAYNQALEIITKSAFPVDWAGTQNNLGIACVYRILGERAENIELAIAAYNQALEITTKSAFPVNWAATQNNLGEAYRNRILGERSENIELAIAAFNQALSVRTKSAFPVYWADTQHNLGAGYSDRILGERADNIELAIAAFNQALSVRTKSAFPVYWAMTQNGLGIAYRNRILGERADNIELAIAAHNQALEVYTKSAFPVDWAGTQNNLGAAYRQRILGERAENIELAIAAYNQALEVYTKSAFPVDWAMTQNNLGNAYRERILGKRAENIELAIAAFNQALEVKIKSAFPVDWAMTQNNLGTAYGDRILGEGADNIELAIAAYNQALSVRTKSAFPVDWADTQNSLGNAYLKRILGERAENIELAIAAYNQALSVRSKSAFPVDWAMTQNNLGNAYAERILGERADNIELAIAAYSAVLEVRTKSAFPQNHAETLLNLGWLYQDEKLFDSAYNTFVSAIATVEALRGDIVSGEEAKRKQAQEWNQLYRRMVEVCLELGNLITAIEYVERSKTRNLIELILVRDSKNIFPSEVVTQLEILQDEIASGQYQLQNGKAENPTALAQHLQQLRQQRQVLQDSYLSVGFGFRFDQFQKTLDKDTAIIEWYITTDRVPTFVIKPNRQELTFWQSQPEDLDALINLVNEYLKDYYNQQDQHKIQWQNQLETRLQKLAQILHIEEILAQIPQECDRLIIIPHRFLHLLPLHALPVKSSYLFDLFPNGVSYAPSCQILQQVQRRQHLNFQSLFAIQNPTEDLSFTDLEVESILSCFPSHQVLAKKEATKAALSQAAAQLQETNYLHFSCHGSFNFNSPENSYLLLADAYVSDTKTVDFSKCLTLGNLFERTFDFSQTRLVVLSACETGLTDFNNTSDEYIGLPSGFLYAGSSSVVSSLWTVNDLSTSFLMIKFIQILKNATDMSIPLAMNQAQRWLRDATKEELQEWVKSLALDSTKKGKIRRQINNMTGEQPFNSPFHWAAFTAVGK